MHVYYKKRSEDKWRLYLHENFAVEDELHAEFETEEEARDICAKINNTITSIITVWSRLNNLLDIPESNLYNVSDNAKKEDVH